MLYIITIIIYFLEQMWPTTATTATIDSGKYVVRLSAS